MVVKEQKEILEKQLILLSEESQNLRSEQGLTELTEAMIKTIQLLNSLKDDGSL